MNSLGYGIRILILTLLLALFAVPAMGWEFTMGGQFNWRCFGFSQLGTEGFFGPYDIDRGTFGSAGNINFWHGKRLALDENGPDLVSGADASGQYTRTTINPQIRFNKAVRLRGQYRIGSWAWTAANQLNGTGMLLRSEYLSSQALGRQQSFSPGYWELLWLSAQTPMGIVSIGKRPGMIGSALMFDGTDNFTVETISLVTKFGPFRIGSAAYPSRVGSGYWNPLDKSGIRQWNGGAFVTYRCGGLDVGAQHILVRMSQGPESDLILANRTRGKIYDRADNFGTAYVKYNNGRFFLNAEGSWYDRIETHNGTKPSYIQHNRALTEIGAVVGPSKASFFWAWISGPDRRHGILIDRQSDLAAQARSNTTAFEPYSHILVYTYGGGNNRFSQSRNGFLTDANVYGLRLDYSIAANLNVFGSCFYAERVSHGYGWGFIKPQLNAGNPTGLVAYNTPRQNNAPAATAPSIPDNGLGYEIDWGFDWKLLEGYTLNGVFGMWQPGGWFKYACVDKSVVGWNNQTAANNWGVNPDRSISPVFAAEVRFVGQF